MNSHTADSHMIDAVNRLARAQEARVLVEIQKVTLRAEGTYNPTILADIRSEFIEKAKPADPEYITILTCHRCENPVPSNVAVHHDDLPYHAQCEPGVGT